MMKLLGSIFDLDGVIVDTARFHYLAWKNLAADLGFDFTPEEGEKIKGVSRMAALDIVLEAGGITGLTQDEKARLADKKNRQYREYLETLSSKDILPGVADFLESLKVRRIRTAIGSASKNTKFILKKIGMSNEFDAVVDGYMTERAKPDPQVFLLAAEGIGLDPSECAVFEDAAAGVEAANRGGMMSFGVGDPAILGAADVVIPDFVHAGTLMKYFAKPV
ncbi:MAG: beta-phosphoglucomutase [Oscillospiraceae bacterium]|jgi:beta-phosphoglucomutase